MKQELPKICINCKKHWTHQCEEYKMYGRYAGNNDSCAGISLRHRNIALTIAGILNSITTLPTSPHFSGREN